MTDTTETKKRKVLSGHYSPETAYLVEDYPYGFRLRCKMRCWLEVNPKKGTRYWTQTTDPKRPVDPTTGEHPWNKPKASTYRSVGAMFMYEDGEEKGYVHWSGLSFYDVAQAQAYLDEFGPGLTETERHLVGGMILVHNKREAQKKAAGGGDPPAKPAAPTEPTPADTFVQDHFVFSVVR